MAFDPDFGFDDDDDFGMEDEEDDFGDDEGAHFRGLVLGTVNAYARNLRDLSAALKSRDKGKFKKNWKELNDVWDKLTPEERKKVPRYYDFDNKYPAKPPRALLKTIVPKEAIRSVVGRRGNNPGVDKIVGYRPDPDGLKFMKNALGKSEAYILEGSKNTAGGTMSLGAFGLDFDLGDNEDVFGDNEYDFGDDEYEEDDFGDDEDEEDDFGDDEDEEDDFGDDEDEEDDFGDDEDEEDDFGDDDEEEDELGAVVTGTVLAALAAKAAIAAKAGVAAGGVVSAGRAARGGKEGGRPFEKMRERMKARRAARQAKQSESSTALMAPVEPPRLAQASAPEPGDNQLAPPQAAAPPEKSGLSTPVMIGIAAAAVAAIGAGIYFTRKKD